MRRDVFSHDAPSLVAETESAKPSPKMGEGAVCARWIRCGKPTCRCMQDGQRHGPYYARYWWRDGRRYKQYVRRRDAERAVNACAMRREIESAERTQADEAHRAWRDLRALIRGIEHGER
jgi:hypothetical protein